MGIFDDAIREHLELKRQIGADESELKELEDEAFGPPARPGDPDFPASTSEEAAIEDGGGEAPGGAGAEVPPGQTPVDAVVDAPTDEPALKPLDEVVAEPVDPPAEPEGGEVAPPEVDAASGVFDAEASEPDPPDADSSFSTAEREAIADQPTVFFEQAPPAELELGDLELDFDEEIEEVGGSLSEPLSDEQPLAVEEVFTEEPAEVAEPPHEVEPAPAEPETEAPGPEPQVSAEPEAEAPPGQSAEPVTSDAAPPTEAAEPGTGEDDVLEETPEFLRDNPDDDELW
ncbi:MAG: hypothetical protein M3355_07815, partial [Actinomycetota bacterium]|nr:hypothetical protein [Actinomycetota bacterium]